MAKQVIAAGVLDGQIIGAVSFRDITTSRGPSRVFQIPFNDGRTYETFKTDIANKAHPLVGQPVSIRYEHTKNGDFDNYVLMDIGSPGSFGQAPGVVPQAFFPPAVAPVAAIQQQVATPAAPNVAQQEREGRIMRGNALNAVGSLLGPFVSTQYFSGEFHLDSEKLADVVVDLCEVFVAYIATGVHVEPQISVTLPASDGIPF